MSSCLTSVDVPDLDASIVQPGCQQQLVLAKLKTVPLNVDTAALFFWNGGAKGHAPDNATTVNGVFGGLTGHRNHRTPFTALPG